MSDDRPAISSPQLSAADVARHTFATVRRGFDPEEVRLYLETVAEELSAAEQREEEMQRELEAAEEQILHPDIDEATLTAALGQLSAAVLRKAHEEAGRITQQSETSAAAILREAHQQATEVQVQAEASSAERIAEAELAANTLHHQARQEAAGILEATRAESDAILERAREQGRMMLEQAQEARRRVLADMGHRRRAMAAQIDQYRAARDEVAAAVVGVRQSVDRIVEDLSRADDDARAAAAEVAHRQPHETTEVVLVAEAEAAAADLGARTGSAADLEATAPLSIDDIRTVVPAHGEPYAGPGVEPLAAEGFDGGVGPAGEDGFTPLEPDAWVPEQEPAGGFEGSRPWTGTTDWEADAAEESRRAPANGEDDLDDRAGAQEPVGPGAGIAHTTLPEPPSTPGDDLDSVGGGGWRPYVRGAEREIYDIEAVEDERDALPGPEDGALPEGGTGEAAGGQDGAGAAGRGRAGQAMAGEALAGEPIDEGPAPAGSTAPGGEDDGVEGLFARLRASQGTKGRPTERSRGTSERVTHGRAADEPGDGGDGGAGGAGGGHAPSATAEPSEGSGGSAAAAQPPAAHEDRASANGAMAVGAESAGTESAGPDSAGPESAGADSAGPEEVPATDEEGAPSGTPEVVKALARRSELLDPVVMVLARRLKRALQDDQNRLLERLRSGNGDWSDTLLPEETEQRELYAGAALPHVRDAMTAGISFARSLGRRRGKVPAPDEAAVQGVADELGGTVVTMLRRRLTGDDVGDAAERVGAAYRESRGERIERLVGDCAVEAFSAGVLAAVPAGMGLRWVRNESSLGCADCEDNALGEAVPTGEEFPTGHLHPPAHAGCRCLVLPTPA